jgi:hypothetical protein
VRTATGNCRFGQAQHPARDLHSELVCGHRLDRREPPRVGGLLEQFDRTARILEFGLELEDALVHRGQRLVVGRRRPWLEATVDAVLPTPGVRPPAGSRRGRGRRRRSCGRTRSARGPGGGTLAVSPCVPCCSPVPSSMQIPVIRLPEGEHTPRSRRPATRPRSLAGSYKLTPTCVVGAG